MTDDYSWMDEELIGILEGRKRPKRRWWAVAARPIPQTSVAPPLDSLPAALTAYGFRRLATAYGGFAMRVTRVSDSATQDIGFVGNNFDTASYNTFIGASSGTVNIWYDQSGGGNNLAASGTAPAINVTGLNGHPTAVFPGAGSRLFNVNPGTFNQPYTMGTVAMRTGAFTAQGGAWADYGFNVGIYFGNSASSVGVYCVGFQPTVGCTDNTAHSLIAVFNGASSAITVDNTSTAQSWAASQMQGTVVGNPGGTNLTGNVSEGIVWQSALSGANVSTLAANQKAYWGTP